MEWKRRVLTCLLIMLIGAGSLVWGAATAVVQGGQMDEMMQMMKAKMMARPDAMKQADTAIQAHKQKAIEEGKYKCCLKHPCDFCALKMGECPCGLNVEKDMPVCNECKGSWFAGDGAVPGKTPEQIKTLPRPVG